jgi:nitroreductase
MNQLITVIQARHTDRSQYARDQRPSDTALNTLLEAARWAPTAHNMQNFEIVVVDDPAMLAGIGAIRRELSAAFLRENYRQMSFSEEALRRKRTGVLASMFPPSWQRPDADPSQIEPGQLRDLLQGAPMLLLVLYDPAVRAPGSAGDFLGIMSLGCVMQNLWLAAQSLGISVQILSAFGASSVQRKLRPMLRLPANRSIAFGCRLGFPQGPTTPSIRVRRELPDFVHRNGYGEPLGLNTHA